MKVLAFHGLKDEDYLWFTFEGYFDPQVAWDTELEPLLLALETRSDGWMPDVVEGKRRRKYNRNAISKSLEEARHETGASIGLYRTKWPALDMTLRLRRPPRTPELDVTLKIKPLSVLSEAERSRELVELMRAWASRYPVSHAVAHSADDAELGGSPLFGREMDVYCRDGFDKIYEVFWLNVFGPKLVETVGRERMLSTPAHLVEELPSGAVLLVTWPTVTDFASKEARLAQARAHAHLRPDLDFDTVLRALHERSALLAPVEPRFDPDLAPLLSRVADFTASHARSRMISGFNAWRPPEPEQWRPATSALPCDVEDLERARAHYRTLAEHLVALLHTQVPSVFEATPESLTDADFYFWREEFPTSRPREAIDEHAVPAVGAYLGEVLVRHLGGEWIPRQTLDEAQVLVGNRVWLPFVRARHFMASRQALLDHSLTQLYRVAERHRG